MAERIEIPQLTVNDAAYNSRTYESEWMPSSICNSFEFYCKVDTLAQFGMEFSNDDSTIVKTVSDRLITNVTGKINSISYAARVRMFVRNMGEKADFTTFALPFNLQCWGYFMKNIEDQSNRVDELCFFGDTNTTTYTSGYVSCDKWGIIKVQAMLINANYDVLVEYSSDGINITKTDSWMANTLNTSISVESKCADRYCRIRLDAATSTNQWIVNSFFFYSTKIDKTFQGATLCLDIIYLPISNTRRLTIFF
jgi:hypothetical protein